MDELVSKIAALGVPGMILITAMNATGFAGAAAITTALAAIGPAGMLGGIATLGIIALITDGLSKYGYEAIMTAVIQQKYKEGYNKEYLLYDIEHRKISKSLKLKLIEKVNQLG